MKIKEIEPNAENVERLRYYLGEITPKMLAAEYADTLVIIVHYCLVEAERLSQLTGDRDPLISMIKQITEAASSFHEGNPSSMN